MEDEANVEMGDALTGEKAELEHVRLARLNAVRLQVPALRVSLVPQIVLRILTETLVLLDLKIKRLK